MEPFNTIRKVVTIILMWSLFNTIGGSVGGIANADCDKGGVLKNDEIRKALQMERDTLRCHDLEIDEGGKVIIRLLPDIEAPYSRRHVQVVRSLKLNDSITTQTNVIVNLCPSERLVLFEQVNVTDYPDIPHLAPLDADELQQTHSLVVQAWSTMGEEFVGSPAPPLPDPDGVAVHISRSSPFVRWVYLSYEVANKRVRVVVRRFSEESEVVDMYLIGE